MKKLAFALLALVLAFAAFYLWATKGVPSPGERPVEVVDLGRGAGPADTATISVATWNVGWAFGWGSEGSAALKPKVEMDAGLERIAAGLVAMNADVVLVQEIDFRARRSHDVNQARALAAAAGYRYLAEGVSWDLNYLPFPYWPPSEHWAHISSGGAILSRLPLERCRIELLEKPAAQAWWYRPMYLFRYLLRCEARLGERRIVLVDTHLEAFDQTNRVEQVAVIAERLAQLDEPLIFGGDMNSSPPEQTKRRDYPDEPETSHEDDPTIPRLRAIPGLVDTIPPERFAADEPAFFTFPAHAPNRKLDSIFASAHFEVLDARVAREVGDPSDHLPVVAKLALSR